MTACAAGACVAPLDCEYVGCDLSEKDRAVCVDGHDDERVRIDELKLGDDAFEALLARAVVDGCDRMMALRRAACDGRRNTSQNRHQLWRRGM